MLTGLPPLISGRTRLLILGSFPGAASLAAQQYYGYPQNHFWKILQAIWPDDPMQTGPGSYEKRSKWLLSKQLGVWDVYAACERQGSLDSNIRKPVINDFAALRKLCPALEAIAHNGGESFKHARYVQHALAEVGVCSAVGEATSVGVSSSPAGAVDLALPVRRRSAPLLRARGSATPKAREATSVGVHFYKLPSTSPANASWSFERKLAAWREVFEKHRLTDGS